jgi:hypothetical protein
MAVAVTAASTPVNPPCFDQRTVSFGSTMWNTWSATASPASTPSALARKVATAWVPGGTLYTPGCVQGVCRVCKGVHGCFGEGEVEAGGW